MKKLLPPPANWQDFETLCKKLFGELWGCALTIKQNGRLGQEQCGVDIYTIPKNEDGYWGIQCKGKGNYANNKITRSEIDAEISKAQKFVPKLKTFIFATTSDKDAAIEQYIREKDAEHARVGGFQILLFCWPDIVDKILECRDTYNWYVNSIGFKDSFDVSVSLNTGETQGTIAPIFRNKTVCYILPPKKVAKLLENRSLLSNGIGHFKERRTYNTTPVNKAWVCLNFEVKNIGSQVLEDWKLIIRFPDVIRKIRLEPPSESPYSLNLEPFSLMIKIDSANKLVEYNPYRNSPLIQKDTVSFECYCYCKAFVGEITETVKWHFLARDFDKEGHWDITIKPEFKEEYDIKHVEDPKDVKTENFIEDFKAHDE
jgi:hypothetical protein